MDRNVLSSRAKLPEADATNEAGGTAYSLPAEQALAIFAMTGNLHGATYYSTVESVLAQVKELAAKVDDEYLAKLAVYSWESGFMKDMSAFLTALLTARGGGLSLFKRVFPRTITTGKQFSTFFQIMRSGAAGRKSLGSGPKVAMRNWLARRTPLGILKASVGVTPSFRDIIRALHVKPTTVGHEAIFGYLSGSKKLDDARKELLPDELKQLFAFRANPDAPCPRLPFQLLTSQNLTEAHWKQIAASASWQTTRMNLATFMRHNVFSDPVLTGQIAARLRNPAEIARSRVFPYQLLIAYKTVGDSVPRPIRDSLQDAIDLSFSNLPEFPGRVMVFVDTSGSMACPVTGTSATHSSAVQCRDVAAIFAAGILRKAEDATVWAFSDLTCDPKLNPRDSVATNAAKLALMPSGGTDCSSPMRLAIAQGLKADLVIYLSDNESWMDHNKGRSTQTMESWSKFKRYNPSAKLVCIDLAASRTAQTKDSADIMNIGGFSDRIFKTIHEFTSGKQGPDFWVAEIRKVNLDVGYVIGSTSLEASTPE